MLNIADHQGNANQNRKEISLIPVSTPVIQKTTCEDVEKEKLCVLLVEWKLVQPLRKTVWRLHMICATIWSSNSTSGCLSKEDKNTSSKRYMLPMLIAALFSIAKIQKQHKCPSISECIKICDICNTYAYNINILGIRKKESWPLWQHG